MMQSGPLGPRRRRASQRRHGRAPACRASPSTGGVDDDDVVAAASRVLGGTGHGHVPRSEQLVAGSARIAASPAFGDSGTSPTTPRWSHARTDAGMASCAASPRRCATRRRTSKGQARWGPSRSRSGRPRSAPPTSEIASVMVWSGRQPRRRPPLTRDRCLRTQLSSSMARPSCMSDARDLLFLGKGDALDGATEQARTLHRRAARSAARRPARRVRRRGPHRRPRRSRRSASDARRRTTRRRLARGARHACRRRWPAPGSSGTSAYQRSSMAADALPAATSVYGCPCTDEAGRALQAPGATAPKPRQRRGPAPVMAARSSRARDGSINGGSGRPPRRAGRRRD